MSNFKIRYANKDDNHQIFLLIKQLGEFEKIADEYVVTEEVLYDSLFVKNKAEVLIGEIDGVPIGYVLFFSNFPTSYGKAGLYIEDIFVMPEYRGRGYGKQIFKYIANIAVNRNCAKMEWICLNWNESAKKFYESLGAEKKEDWVVYSLMEDGMKKIAQSSEDKNQQ